jgi:hypothetical protein
MTLLPARMNWMLLAGFLCLFSAGTAVAQSNPATCANDDDCIATPACGGDVCDWATEPGLMKCKAAGSYPKGEDGWCTTTDDCKCKGMGATCMNFFCTFTRPCDAPGAAGCGTGGTGGTGGSGGSGTGAAGSTGMAGTSGGGGSDGGGCAVGATAPIGASTLLVAFGLLVFSRRRRR